MRGTASRRQRKNEVIVMTSTYAAHATHGPAGLAETELAERLGLVVFDKAYDRRFRNHVWFVVAAVCIGLLGAIASVLVLRSPTLGPQAVQFWLLCFVLAGGLLVIAIVVFAGSLTTHLAMMRIADLRRDTEASESIAEQAALTARLEAFQDLMQNYMKTAREDRGPSDREIEIGVASETIELIMKASDPNMSAEVVSSLLGQVVRHWQYLGADSTRITTLEERCRPRATPSKLAA